MRGYLNAIVEPEFKGVGIASPAALRMFEDETYHQGTSSLVFLDEVIATQFKGLAFSLNSPYYEAFDRKLNRMIECGFIDLYHKEKLRHRLMSQTKNYEVSAQVLEMKHLRIGFAVILILLGVSTVVFFIECLILRSKMFWRTIRQYISMIEAVRQMVEIIFS